MNILISEDQFKAWKGKNVKDMDLGEWEAWALDFFHNKDFIKDPWLQITIRLDITEARNNYLANYNKLSSFTRQFFPQSNNFDTKKRIKTITMRHYYECKEQHVY